MCALFPSASFNTEGSHLHSYVEQYPAVTPSVRAMQRSLTNPDVNTVGPVFDKYLGQTQLDASTRHKTDKQRASGKSRITNRWRNRLRFSPGDIFKIYELSTPAIMPVDGEQVWTSEQSWYGNPAYGILEYLLVLSSCGRSWNSAHGGPCILPRKLAHLNKFLHRPKSTGATATCAVETLTSERDFGWMKLHFEAARAAFSEAGCRLQKLVPDAALIAASRNAVPSSQSSFLVLAKDITVWEAQGYGSWWTPTAG